MAVDKSRRNTSAYAEKTSWESLCESWLWKHLRLRGENRLLFWSLGRVKETPPLTRRKRKAGSPGSGPPRNTSAYAEKTL